MANFPTSLDTITNPTSGNTLDNPSHSLQHSDANDILEALERKVGIGSSVAGSASAGHVLVASTGGTTSWTTVGTASITSGAATNGQVLTANGSGAVTFNTPTQGLTLINTTSFSGVASSSFPADTFTTTYNNYFIVVDAATAGAGYLQFRLRAAGTDATGSNYNFSYVRVIATTASGNTTTQTQFPFPHSGSITNNYGTLYVYNPKLAVPTGFMANSLANADGVAITGGMHTLSTSYDSITLFTSTGNMTGSISIYGVNK